MGRPPKYCKRGWLLMFERIKELFSKQGSLKKEYTDIGQKGRKITKNVGVLSFYTGLADKYFKHDDYPTESLGNGSFYYTPESIITKNGIKKPFLITMLPEEIDRGFISDLRLYVDKAMEDFRLNTGIEATVSINLTEDMVHYNLNLNSLRTRNRWVGFVRLYKKLMEESDKPLEDALKTDTKSDGVRRKVKSFLHIREAMDQYRAAFYKTTLFIEILAQSDDMYNANDSLKEAEKAVRGFCIQNDIKIKRMFLDAHNYYKNFAPSSSFDDSTLMRRKFTGSVFSDDTLSSFTVPEHGKVGDPVGVYHGIDIRSREVVSFDLAKGSSANNWLVTASTGEGKSRMMKTLLTFYAIDPEYQSVIFDYEGTEYAALGKVTNAATIAVGSSQGSYVNTMVVTKPTGDAETDLGRLNRAKDMTTKVFDLLFDQYDGMSKTNLSIFSYLLDSVYSEAGVNEDQPEFWYERTKHLTFYTLYQKLSQLMDEKRDKTFFNQFDDFEIREFYNTIVVYFAKGQVRNYWFTNPIDIDEFLETKDVIFNFDMGGSGEEMVDAQQLALRQLFASHLTNLKSMYNKQKGVRTVVVIEEMQRYLKHKFSRQIVSTFVSGGRKNGLIVYLVTNAPQELLMEGSGNTGMGEKDIGVILGNITSQIIGALYKSDMNSLIDYFGLEDSEGYLAQLVDIKENERKNAPLKYCFYVKHRDQRTMVKFIVHPAFDKSPLYYTAPSTVNKTLMSAEDIETEDLIGQISRVAEEEESNPDKYKEKINRVWI